MSESVTSTETVDVPTWLADMKFCHVGMGDEGRYSYCGNSQKEGEPADCSGFYEGEAICEGCGMPVCPRCAQLCDIEDRLDAA